MTTTEFKKMDYYEKILDYISKKYPNIIIESIKEYYKEKEKNVYNDNKK